MTRRSRASESAPAAKPRRVPRRRVPRRRFHALHLEIGLTLALALSLPFSIPYFRIPRADAAPAAVSFALALPPAEPGPAAPGAAQAAADAEVFTPLLFAFGTERDPARVFLPAVPEPFSGVPAAECVEPFPGRADAAPDAPDAAAPGPVPLPGGEFLAALSPAPSPFEPEARPAPVPAPPRRKPPEALLFPAAGMPIPTVLVDAPDAALADLPALEARAAAAAAPTGGVLRIHL